MAEANSRWPLTAEAKVRVRVNSYGTFSAQSGTGTGFISPSSSVFPCNYIIPPLLHTHLSPPHEVYDSSNQAAN
jgi:hypothetical protein